MLVVGREEDICWVIGELLCVGMQEDVGQGEPERGGSHRGEKSAVCQAEIWVIDEKLLCGFDHGRFAMLFNGDVYPDQCGCEVPQNSVSFDVTGIDDRSVMRPCDRRPCRSRSVG